MQAVTKEPIQKDVPEGYKRTEVGVVPIDWKVQVLKSSSTLSARIGWQGLTTDEYLENGDYFLVTGTDFKKGRVLWDKCHYVNYERFSQDKKIQLKKKDVLVTKDGTIGKVAIVKEVPKPATLNSGIFVIRPGKQKFDPSFFFYILLSKYFKKFLEQLSAGSTINHLYQRDIVKFKYPIPSTLQEQRAIAEALSDVDALIAELDAFIEKKQKIKKGAMQQLLSGKKRLPGFSGKWEERKLGELVDVKGGKRLPKGWSLQDSENLYPYIKVADMTLGGVNRQNIQYVPEGAYEQIKKYRIFINDLFISVAGTLGIVGEIPKKLNGANLTENADKLTNIQCDKKYLKHYLISPEIQDEIETTKTIGAQPKLAISRIKEFSVFLPTKLEEQKAIAGILSDMNAEIQSIQQKRAKYQKIKQGMMQELLTGKTRLIKNEQLKIKN